MALIPREIVEAVRERTDLVGLIGRYVRLDKKGNNWVGLCPFHDEKSGSFNVNPNQNFFHCFGCRTSGDCYRFLMLHEKLSFHEAVRQLADEAGITIEAAALDPVAAARMTAEQRMFRMLEEAAQRFESQLWAGPDGAHAREYLAERGLPDDVVRKFRLGLAPADWSTLHDTLVRSGFQSSEIVEAGLAKTSENGRTYDLFRNRLMIPITDDRGRVVAFGGRILAGEGPKYINSPETLLYHKGSVLYGWSAAQQGIRHRKRVILVEGYFDVIAMHRAGFSEAVATCGTALTQAHVRRLHASKVHVLLLTDTDDAGEEAATKALPLLRAASIQTMRPALPQPAKDPDDALKLHGADALKDALASAPSLLEAVARRKLRLYGFSAAARQRAIDEIIELLPNLTDPEMNELSLVIKVPFADIKKRAATRPAAPAGAIQTPRPPPSLDISVPEMHILWLAIHHRDVVADLLELVDPNMLDARIRPVVARLLMGDPALRLFDEGLAPELEELLSRAIAKEGLFTPSNAAKGLVDNVLRLAKSHIDASRAQQHERVRAAQDRKDEEAVRRGLMEVQRLLAIVTRAEAAIKGNDLRTAMATLRLDA
jgi:DNA primase